MSSISQSLIAQASASPSKSTNDQIAVFHNRLRVLLVGCETFLQGSYANDTAISDINDVDIVALEDSHGLGSISADNLFQDIKDKIESDSAYKGKVIVNRKCLTVNLITKKADIVPAVKGLFDINKNSFGEPIYIVKSIKNYPKTHINRGKIKNKEANDNYKKIVRMVKHFVNNWNVKDAAPSFYLECMVHSYPNNFFQNDLPVSLYGILSFMVGNSFNPNFSTLAGDKCVISQTEWNPQAFIYFRGFVSNILSYLSSSITTNSEREANFYFERFFNL